MTRTVAFAVLVLAVIAASGQPAHADAQKTRDKSEAVVRFFAPLVIGDYEHLHVRCHRHGRGTWKCRVRWSSRTDAVTVTRCRNPAFWNRPDEVEMDDSQTRCRATTAATRG